MCVTGWSAFRGGWVVQGPGRMLVSSARRVPGACGWLEAPWWCMCI